MDELKRILDDEEEDGVAYARVIEFAICALSTRPALTRRLLYKLAQADTFCKENAADFSKTEATQ